jgi:ATP-dependent Clp protease ATP-binding subunit ClpA
MTIESECLLLGLLREDANLLNRFLHSRTPEIRDDIRSQVTIREKVPTSVDLPLSMESMRILSYAAEESEKLAHNHIGTEHLLLGILREENCLAEQVLARHGLKLEAVRAELSRPLVAMDLQLRQTTQELQSPFSFLSNPALPKTGVVADADTAKRIAEAVWIPLYGAETIFSQQPLQATLQHNVWIVTGLSAPETALFVFIHQADGRILSVGRGPATQ